METIKHLPSYIIESIINELQYIGFDISEIEASLNLTGNELSELIQYDIMAII